MVTLLVRNHAKRVIAELRSKGIEDKYIAHIIKAKFHLSTKTVYVYLRELPATTVKTDSQRLKEVTEYLKQKGLI